MKVITQAIQLMLRKQFDSQVNTSHIKYDWDSGHCYSYIDHPLVHDNSENDEFQEYTNDWLYSNDECPLCCMHIMKDGSVSSDCGCHDRLDKDKDAEQIADIVEELEALSKQVGYALITREE